MARYGYMVESIRHADMFTLMDNFKSDFPESANDPFRREVGKKHLDCDLDLDRFPPAGLFLDHHQVGSDSVFDVFQGFL